MQPTGSWQRGRERIRRRPQLGQSLIQLIRGEASRKPKHAEPLKHHFIAIIVFINIINQYP